MSFVPALSRRSLLSLAVLGGGALTLAACGGGGESEDGTPMVVTSNYPLRFLVERIGGDRVTSVDFATPGADAHGLELSVRQVMQVQEAALVLQIPGYQTAIDDAIASGPGDNVLDVAQVIELLVTELGDTEAEHEGESAEEHAEHADDTASDAGGESAEEDHEGHDHGGTDPHLWHDPLRIALIGDALAERLSEIDAEGADGFTERAAALRTELEALDEELAESFGAVEGTRTFVTSHAAYSYLAARYDLHQVGISGIDPETEPSPQRLLELEKVIDAEGVTTVFFEATASPKVAQTLAENVGITSEELDNLETQLSEDADYPQVMRENARKLVESWQ
ncbi:metal ABC transporter substrate-binding protein [Brachybacterium sp. J153]|uniref:metal ABC transporter substrate-binding protein n=1 Tax=Brachybacterium sp. J153 TaxID=3116488 RepID=UPI002E760144|nr:metal ABC transporter substrate-binding protein [Brachybacterium sp. J153]MEE1617295.1 metal ABC transporter substrate-binding protein [Brachybacterium sp. J153]